MTTTRFSLTSSLTPDEVRDVLTDFSPSRAESWPTIDSDHFTVHGRGDNWAEVTEGTESGWERARYDWAPDGDRVQITTLDSKVFGPGGGWTFSFAPVEQGTRVDIELVREPAGLKRKILASLLPIAAPKALTASFGVPLKAL